jgi:hypothetical protein
MRTVEGIDPGQSAVAGAAGPADATGRVEAEATGPVEASGLLHCVVTDPLEAEATVPALSSGEAALAEGSRTAEQTRRMKRDPGTGPGRRGKLRRVRIKWRVGLRRGERIRPPLNEWSVSSYSDTRGLRLGLPSESLRTDSNAWS